MGKKEKKDNRYEGCYGSLVKSPDVIAWLENLCQDNMRHHDMGLPRWTGNIWGLAGSGKTAVVKDFQNRKVTFRGKEYDGYEIIDIPLAMLEEVGDVLGLPESFVEMEKDGLKEWILKDFVDDMLKCGWKSTGKSPVTKYAPPSWVPTEERPGILLFDDGNRAAPRIMKGLMQLVQDYRTVSWELPAGWTIVFTGNPDTAEYSVTTQDCAQLTRMRHITMKLDVREWVNWATEHGVDGRGIGFALKYPEMIEEGGERTNLRTYTEFCRCLERYPDKLTDSQRKSLVVDGNSLLDEEIVSTFITFMEVDMKLVIDPERILEDSKFALKEVRSLMEGKEPRIDIISITCNRLVSHILSSNYVMKPEHIKNFQDFITCEGKEGDFSIPKDISQCIMRQITSSKRHELFKFVMGNKTIMEWCKEGLANTRLISDLS